MQKSKKNKYHLVGTDKEYKIYENKQGEVIINGKKIEVSITPKDGFLELNHNGKTYFAEIVEKDQNKYVVLINGNTYKFSVETPISYKRKKILGMSLGRSSKYVVEAPMPGNVIEIMVEKDSEIKAGDTLLVLEAMKMQNEIISEVNGVVKKISCSTNSYVNKDDVLVEIEKS